MDTEKNNQAPPDPANVPTVLPAAADGTVKLPIFLRWPLLVVLLFVLPPFGTIAALILAVIRLVFTHKHPQYKLKIRTKVIVGVCCAAFFAWCMTLEPVEGSDPSVDPSSAQAESAALQQTEQEEEQAAQEEQAARAEEEAQKASEQQAKEREKAYKKIDKALAKEKTDKAAKALAKVDEGWSFSYYQDLLQTPIANRDTEQLQRYLTIYRQAYPDTDKMDKVLTAWDEICANNTAVDELDDQYRQYGGIEGANSKADSAEERTFYVQYKLRSTMANSDNDIISAIGEAIDSLQESASEEYEYLANNVTNNLMPSLVMGYIDLDVYPGDERYVLVCDQPFSQSGATTVYAYESGTRTLSTTDGFEQEVPCYRVIDSAVIDAIRADYQSYSLLHMQNAELYEQMKQNLLEV